LRLTVFVIDYHAHGNLHGRRKVMEEERAESAPDLELAFLAKQDLSTLSVEDLHARIGAMEAEIERCRQAVNARGATRDAADKLFKL